MSTGGALSSSRIFDVSVATAPGEPEFYDDALIEAVKHFQARHGLDVDGVVGPASLVAMNVPIEADWKSPCTVLVARAEAATVPESCFDGGLSGMRSRKLVSSRLNAVVCEFAMLPEMFSSANDCARSPVTAVVSAPKIPMPSSVRSKAR
jgi:hypothetical protein